MSETLTYFRGKGGSEGPSVAATAPAVRHGIGCFTTARWRRSQLVWRDDHLARLRATLAYFGWEGPTDLEKETAEAEAFFREAVPEQAGTLRLALLDLGLRLELCATFHPETLPPALGAAGLRVALTDPTDSFFQIASHGAWKVASYLSYREARRRVEAAGFDEGLLWHPDGGLAEACYANVFLRSNGCWLTPALRPRGPLPGLARARALALLESLRHRAVEVASLDSTTIQTADAAFLTNARIGLAPVRSLGGRQLPKREFEEVQALRRAFEAAFA
ncbi:MAG: aminotransferase class IV [Opitutales bacterium]